MSAGRLIEGIGWVERQNPTRVFHGGLDSRAFADLRRRLVLECCKWDPQVGDTATLAPFPLVLPRPVWSQLAAWSEKLAAEAVAAEGELLDRADLLSLLGLPTRIRRVLNNVLRRGPTPVAARVIRFDFHWTTQGWRISEANADVPGGFTEASSFAMMMAEHYPSTTTAGNPAGCLIDAITGRASAGGAVALLAAPGYMEDQQVVRYLARLLRSRGVEAHVCGPQHLHWHGGRAQLESEWHRGPVGAVVRFYQGEWLAKLPRSGGWPFLFHSGLTPVTNPGSALVIESKRFPLVWDSLSTPLPTWRALLPETCDPRDAPWRRDSSWLLKAAFCNTGDEVAIRQSIPLKHWKSACRLARWRPSHWVAQRRFEPIPAQTPMGPMYPCLGVYTIDGRAAGIYGRLSPAPVIDYAAIDVAVLVDTSGTKEQQ